MSIFDKEKLKILKPVETVRKHTIMLVDDETAVLTSLKSLISDEYNIITAQDGQEALEIIKNMDKPEEISLIISDQRMPRMTGIQLFELLIEILPKSIRIILSGVLDIPLILEAISKAKIYEFILKPFEINDLRLRLRRAIEAFERQRELDEYRRSLEERNRELEQKNKELEEAKKKLEESCLIDPLTGLRNRRYIESFIQNDLSKVQIDIGPGKDVIFYVMDVDHLKSVNSLFNHRAGDVILTQLTTVLKQECHPSDVLVRWGNDEFLVVIYFADRNQAHTQAEHMRQVVEKHRFQLQDGQSTQITCSIGFAAYPFLLQHPGALNWEQVITIVEKALHAAQKSGGNAWIGIKSTEKTKTDNLCQLIRKEIDSLIVNEELVISTSIPDRNSIVWMQ